jgi:hypothetical protein
VARKGKRAAACACECVIDKTENVGGAKCAVVIGPRARDAEQADASKKQAIGASFGLSTRSAIYVGEEMVKLGSYSLPCQVHKIQSYTKMRTLWRAGRSD